MAFGEVVYRSVIRAQVAEITVVDQATETYRLTVDDVPQSQVCLADPTLVDFDYARYIARLIDGLAARGAAVTCAHLGGGALTLPRYVAATRPGSVQYVVESEAERTADLLGVLPLGGGSDVRLLFGDARALVDAVDPATPPWSAAAVTVVDLWAGSTIAARVSSLEFYRRLASMGAPGGVLAVNLNDGPGFGYARRQAASLGELYEHVAVVVDAALLDGPPSPPPGESAAEHHAGNVLLVASNRELGALSEPGWPLGDHNPPRVLLGETLRSWIGDAPPMTDRDATDSPPPGRDAGDLAGDARD